MKPAVLPAGPARREDWPSPIVGNPNGVYTEVTCVVPDLQKGHIVYLRQTEPSGRIRYFVLRQERVSEVRSGWLFRSSPGAGGSGSGGWSSSESSWQSGDRATGGLQSGWQSSTNATSGQSDDRATGSGGLQSSTSATQSGGGRQAAVSYPIFTPWV